MNRWHIKFNSAYTLTRFITLLETVNVSQVDSITNALPSDYNWAMFTLPEGARLPQSVWYEIADYVLEVRHCDGGEWVLGLLQFGTYSLDPEFKPISRNVYAPFLGDNIGSIGYTEFEKFIDLFGDEVAESLLNGDSDALYGILPLKEMLKTSLATA